MVAVRVYKRYKISLFIAVFAMEIAITIDRQIRTKRSCRQGTVNLWMMTMFMSNSSAIQNSVYTHNDMQDRRIP